MNKEEIINSLTKKMNGALQVLDADLKGLRVGQASVYLLDPVQVEAYNSTVPILQVATVSVSDAKTILVQVWDKGLLKSVKKAILEANLGVSIISDDNQIIRLQLPIPSEERRKELVKIAHKYQEKSKIVIRNIRRDGIETIKQMEKNTECSKDEARIYNNEIQELTNQYCDKIDKIIKLKEQDIINF
ncbi:ribosome recycling factor [Orientia chuto str. Dubai]|uniref:Ribosome-recycling factor n=1 Tax=Orientia chuto str. Dubai TaxID=1359168 RepID=A0A0F3MJJ0_9RICK|nr:ribosome recycling factor [Candidatus Orientia mediorientalis]KJV55943.1 ribosome recycling factor [Orientia chuto str. Dubai]